ncbi:hypothetical protein [Rossellomorea sp. NPDC077527]|uniref:hypothetical protein n=1 Tax=Rossellomorea sp. NPDC077527 TaxID=3364510 RepID=UPI0037CC1A26
MKTHFSFPVHLQGRNMIQHVIPTVCNLKNMLEKLDMHHGDETKLKSWEKRCFTSYRFLSIKDQLVNAPTESRIQAIKQHLLSMDPSDFGANPMDIYIIAFVAETYGPGKENLIHFVQNNGISEKVYSANAIWQVGKRDGVYLGLLNEDGSVLDWDFFKEWLRNEIHTI